MLLLRGLDQLVHVAAGLQQVVVGLLDLVLLQFDLRLQQVQLVLDRGLVGIGGLRELRLEAGHRVGVARELLLRPCQGVLDAVRLLAEHGGVCLDVAQRGTEGEVELVVGELQRLLGQRTLVGGACQARQPLRGQEGVLVDDRDVGRSGGRRRDHRMRRRCGFVGGPQPIGCRGQQQREDAGDRFLQ